MMTSLRLAILCSTSNTYLLNMCFALMKGFHRIGVDCQLLDADKPAEALSNELDKLCPDAVFEINRTRGQSPLSLPASCLHLCWIQDAWHQDPVSGNKLLHRADPRFGGSDLLYGLLKADYFGLQAQATKQEWRILQPGADTELYPNLPDSRPEPGLASICGYIPKPIKPTPDMHEQVIARHQGRQVSVGDLIFSLSYQYKVSISRHSTGDIHQLMTDEINRRLGIAISVDEMLALFGSHWTLLLLDTELPRIPDRLSNACAALDEGLQLALYGPNQWLGWERLAPYYQRNLSWGSELANVYRRSQFNLHNGAFGMHQRVLECMAAGGTILINHTDYDPAHDVQAYFNDGEHYIAYQPETLRETLALWKNRHDTLRDIGQQATAHVRKHHRWENRAATIVADIRALRSQRRLIGQP
ncbi:glycosyltransferase [Vogesella urethralis]|uniref:glycosyltransferase family protein n=1 Tax=Vogesella urethralis TaxID=2592656 RepID=UPI001184A2DD|nr:glycosyltransferase [Vogesella urethralis]